MALRPLNSIAGFSTGDPAFVVIQANGDVTTVNLTANGISNLGNVGNVHILGGNADQYLKTDGLGNLIWSDVANASSNRAAVMPYLIPNGESYIVNENFQGLYTQPITIDGELEVDGMLIEIGDSIQAAQNEILFDFNGTATGNTGFTFEYWSGNLNLPGNLNLAGNIIPSVDDTFDLGNSTRRWRNGYFGGNTIYLDTATITVNNDGYVVITNETGGQFVVAGNSISNTTSIVNGTSNLIVNSNGNIALSVAGTSNVLVVTTAGANLTGNLTATGIKTNNLYYANGQPWDLSNPDGSNTQVQFNNNGDFGASANFTFDKATNNLSIIGNIVSSTGAIYGNGSGLTQLAGANVTGTVANATYATNAGTVTTAAQPNITSLGTLTGLSVNGNISVSGTANLTDLSVTGNAVVGGNLSVNGNLIYINVTEVDVEDPIITLNSGANGVPPASNTGKDVGTALNYYDTQARVAFMGWDVSNAEFAFGSQTTITNEVVAFNTLGNVRAQTFIGNVEATTIAGNLTTATQSNITTVGTLGSLAVTANITAGNVTSANVISANYLISTSGCVTIGAGTIAVGAGTGGIFNSSVNDINFGLAANVTIGSATGNTTIQGNLVANNNITVTGNISANLITGTLTTASQANITTVGTLTNLTVAGNANSNSATSNTVTTNSTISKRSNIAVTTDTVIDSFDATLYRTAKYVIKSESDLGYESLEVLLIHNNINSYITVYAAINDGGGNTVSITSGISSGNVELRATGLSTGTIVNLIGTYVPD